MIVSGTLSLGGIVEAQSHSVWYIVLQPVGFILYLIAAVAETNRAPFDLPEAESELVAGYHTEYSGMRFAMYFIAEYVDHDHRCRPWRPRCSSAAGPVPFLPGGPGGCSSRCCVFLFLFVWLRATLPRLRYDQLMRLSLGRAAADRPAQRRGDGDHRRRDRLSVSG